MFTRTKVSLVLVVFSIAALAACSGLPEAANIPSGMLSAPTDTVKLASFQNVNQTANSQQTVSIADYQQMLEQTYDKVNPSVVNVDVVEAATSSFMQIPGHQFGFGNPGSQVQQTALGSGFVWDTQGHIVTNNHVVDGATKINVTFADGTSAPAKLVGADPNADLAVIQVNVPASELQPVTLTDSSQVKVGQLAIAIGNPFGLSGTMTSGIVSGLGRTLPVGLDNSTTQTGPTYSIPDIIQTDASINPGNSGGVLVNDQGQVMGVTAAIESPSGTNSGIGFVIPSVIVQKVVPALIQTGHYDHPYVGISGTTLTSDLITANHLSNNQQGALVVDVVNNGPASKAGLVGSSQTVTVDGQQVPVGGDVIIAVDQHPIKRFEDMVAYLFENKQVGDTVTFTLLRNGQQHNVQLTLGVLPASSNQ